MIKVGDITGHLLEAIPRFYQESYDNSGMQAGDTGMEIGSAILSLDVTEEVIDEAIETGAGLVISHHPLIFEGLKQVTGRSAVERTLVKAIKNDIAIFSAHTNLDVITEGVSQRLAEQINIMSGNPLQPLEGKLSKVAVYVPASHMEPVTDALYRSGAGTIGNYDHCSFQAAGNGTYRPGDEANPYRGNRGEDHTEIEVKIETVIPRYMVPRAIDAMVKAHPYEEVAYDIYNIENPLPGAGMGFVGDLVGPMEQEVFLEFLRNKLELQNIRYAGTPGRIIKRVAVCGGSGSSLIGHAKRSGADAFITGDIRYHSFFEAGNDILLVDIGHYESEKYSLEILYEIITKKFPKFAVRFSKINTNPVNYLPAWKK